jgi:archaemetzincin
MLPVGVVPFWGIDAVVPKAVAAHLIGYLDIAAEIQNHHECPRHAYDSRRLQYDAGAILNVLESMPFHGCAKVIGILDVDLFVPILSYVFGEARQGGRCALISINRLKRNPDGSEATMPVLLERASKVALHELGHLFSLVHCEDERCLMHFSGGVKDLDKSPPYFCRYCSVYLRDALYGGSD